MKNDFKNSRFKPTLELVFYIVVKNLEELLINIIIRTYRIEEGEKKTLSTNYLDPRCIINPEFWKHDWKKIESKLENWIWWHLLLYVLTNLFGGIISYS